MNVNVVPLDNLIKPAKLTRAGRRALPILSMTMRGGLVDQASKFKKRIASVDTSSYKVVFRDQLVVGFPIDEGVLSIQDLYDEAIVSPAYDVWELKAERDIEPRYLERFLRSPLALDYYSRKLRGTTARRRTLPDDVFLKLEVPFPALPEQHRLVDILDKAEAIVSKRNGAMVLTEKLLYSAFLEMFGHPVTNPKGWQMKPLRTLLTAPLRNGLSPALEGTHTANVLTLAAITRGGFDASAVKEACFAVAPGLDVRLDERDFLICRGNGSLALVGSGAFPNVSDPSVVFPDTMIAARVDHDVVARSFMSAIWKSSLVRRQIESGARTTNGTHKVNQALIESVRIPVPPPAQQQLFDATAARVASLLKTQQRAVYESNELFRGLIYRAMSGELTTASTFSFSLVKAATK